ncbi:MAG: S8 family serine peptidase [Nitrospirota bacterium]
MGKIKHRCCYLIILFVLFFTSITAFADQSLPEEGEILVQFKKHVENDLSIKREAFEGMGINVIKYFPLSDVYLVRTSNAQSLVHTINRLKAHPGVQYAEPNYKRYLMALIPDDPLFGSQWGLSKIFSPAAWEIEQGDRNVLVAVADTGVDLNHSDLTGNLWTNPREICNNGIDDDIDGYVDNCHGINAITGSGNPMDDYGHGTHVSGIIGAAGNNGIGISGVNWQVSLMALKIIGSSGTGTVADEIEAIEFARQKGAKVFNMSYGGYNYSDIERQTIASSEDMLFVAAACNEARNNDITPCYPASFELPNLISVAASTQDDDLVIFSNYGKKSVSVAAPGFDILSTYLPNTYVSLNGTSMATPFVSGLAALILARNPGFSVTQLKDQILRTVDKIPALDGKILTDGRINAYRALTETVSGPYIYNISPTKGSIGSIVTIRGSNFKTVQGAVLFTGDIEAPVTSWSNEKIFIKVPAGAVTGAIRVITSEGTSNSVNFEVTFYPTNIRILFPHALNDDKTRSLIIFSNPFDSPITVYIRFAATSGKNMLTSIILDSHEKIIFDSAYHFGFANESFSVDCQSEDFFAAVLLMANQDFSNITFIPYFIGSADLNAPIKPPIF